MPKPFAENLRHLEGGTFMERIGDELSQLITTVDTSRKPGEMVIKIKVKPVGSSNLGLTTDVAVKLPKEKPYETVLYATPDGNLTPEHPKQQNLELRVAESDRPASLRQAS